MHKQPGGVRLSRRAFLRQFGVAATTLVVGQLVTACSGQLSSSQAPDRSTTPEHMAARQEALRVGVLLPQSQLYPMIGANFRAGMELYQAQSRGSQLSRPLTLQVQEYGMLPSVALEQAQALIANQQVDMIVGSLSSGTAATLHPLLHERQMPLLVSNIGANLSRTDRQSPYIVRNSFSYWQSSWALGRWAAGNLGRRAFVASSFYDSGYDSLYAFQLGFESAGGAIQSTRVTHRPADTSSLEALMGDIRRARPDLVFAAYSGPQASDFVRAYAQAGISARIPLIGSAFLADENQLPAQGDAALGIKTALPWAPALDRPANQAFASAFQRANSRPADPFAILGYDTARLIAQCACEAGSPDQLRRALAGAAFESPRGPARMNTTLLEAETPLYLREVRAGAAGPFNAVVEQLPAIPATDPQIAAMRAAERTVWNNTYLSV
jgi:branched-chain amino acid transport system substrate-binding protein